MTKLEFRELYQSIVFQREIERQELEQIFRHKTMTNCASILMQLRFTNRINEISLEEDRREKFLDDLYKGRANELKKTDTSPETMELYLSSARAEIIQELLNNRAELHNQGNYFIEHELFSMPLAINHSTNFTAMSHAHAVSDSNYDSDDDCEEIGAFVMGGLSAYGAIEDSH